MKILTPTILRSVLTLRSTLSQYHPLVIEGHTRDSRDPSTVANQIISKLQTHWEDRNITKPIILITQGDPLKEKGISAITRNVANGLNVKRCLVCLDEEIDPNHTLQADRHDVIYELKYSQLIEILEDHDGEIVNRLSNAVKNKISHDNAKRSKLGKKPLADWYLQYALLQEVTKSALKIISGDVTVAHTTKDIIKFSVTSFYEVGLDLGLINEEDMLYFS
jgi:hypothetical protein